MIVTPVIAPSTSTELLRYSVSFRGSLLGKSSSASLGRHAARSLQLQRGFGGGGVSYADTEEAVAPLSEKLVVIADNLVNRGLVCGNSAPDERRKA